MKKILMLMCILCIMGYAKNDYVVINDKSNKNMVTAQKGSYKILEFSKMISTVKVSDGSIIKVEFFKNKKKPLRTLKVYAQQMGTSTIFVNFTDESHTQIKLNITQDLTAVIKLVKKIGKDINVEQANGKIILKGTIETNKDRNQTIDIFKKASIDVGKDLIDTLKVVKPDRMLRIKLYVTEIDNIKGKEIKHNWAVGFKNFLVIEDGNDRPSVPFNEFSNAIENAVTLSGGLTAAANMLTGEYFNTGLVLNYLSEMKVAKILEETTLVAMENKVAEFHAGGTIYVKIRTTDNDGNYESKITPLKYGLQLEMRPKNIVDNKFVDLEITTKSTEIDWSNSVDGIPNFKEKVIKTSVLIENKSTIVLGGLLNNRSEKIDSKIPILGDIPLLGRLFRSNNYRDEQKELVFFIVPEIVDVSNHNKPELLKKKKKLILEKKKKKNKV